MKYILAGLLSLSLISNLFADETKATRSNREVGESVFNQMKGCFIVDYFYLETESLKDGYTKSKKIYDPNLLKQPNQGGIDQTVKEWIDLEQVSPNQFRLQHILFSVGVDGKVIEESFLKHQAEDWVYNGNTIYDFVSPGRWEPRSLDVDNNDFWIRKITNLDDGLRYQCAASFELTKTPSQWTCSNYSPIPGRETRDMQRKDYNTLDRSTLLTTYSGGWLERQSNIKTIYKETKDPNTNEIVKEKIPLAKETGRNWYIRIPDSECQDAIEFAIPRKDFWALLRDTWNEVLDGSVPFVEVIPAGQPPRFFKMMEIEDKYLGKDLKNSEIRSEAKKEILATIDAYRSKN